MYISKAKKGSKKKTVLKIFLILLLLAVVGVSVVAYRQRENIKAFMDSRKYTKEELAEQMTESKEKVQQAMEQYDIPVMRDFTVEEEEKIRKGELTVDEAMQLIMAESAGAEKNVAEENAAEGVQIDSTFSSGSNARPSGSENKTTPDSIVANYVTQVYGLKAYYIGQLGAVESEMRSVYKSSGADKSQVPAIVQSYLPRIAAMESECDAKIAGLTSGLRSELSAIGADTSIADSIQSAYEDEKALRKAYYLSQY